MASGAASSGRTSRGIEEGKKGQTLFSDLKVDGAAAALADGQEPRSGASREAASALRGTEPKAVRRLKIGLHATRRRRTLRCVTWANYRHKEILTCLIL